MQDQIMAPSGSVLSGTQVTIPADVVDVLRRAVYAEIGGAAEAIDTLAFAHDRESRPEWFRASAESLWEGYGLLDEMGWAKTTPPVAVRIDLCRGWALLRALAAALEFADDDAGEIAKRDTEVAWMCALWDLTAVVQARIDALAVQEEAEPVQDIAA